MRVDAKGQFLADLKLTLMPSAERSRRLGIEGTWQIDLDALARQPVLADPGDLALSAHLEVDLRQAEAIGLVREGGQAPGRRGA